MTTKSINLIKDFLIIIIFILLSIGIILLKLSNDKYIKLNVDYNEKEAQIKNINTNYFQQLKTLLYYSGTEICPITAKVIDIKQNAHISIEKIKSGKVSIFVYINSLGCHQCVDEVNNLIKSNMSGLQVPIIYLIPNKPEILRYFVNSKVSNKLYAINEYSNPTFIRSPLIFLVENASNKIISTYYHIAGSDNDAFNLFLNSVRNNI